MFKELTHRRQPLCWVHKDLPSAHKHPVCSLRSRRFMVETAVAPFGKKVIVSMKKDKSFLYFIFSLTGRYFLFCNIY
jgi:hypothetical protein